MGEKMIDDDEYVGPEAIIDEFPIDPVAARCEAFTRLVALAEKLENEDLRKEAMMMLGAVRRSFKTLPAGELASVPGGKS